MLDTVGSRCSLVCMEFGEDAGETVDRTGQPTEYRVNKKQKGARRTWDPGSFPIVLKNNLHPSVESGPMLPASVLSNMLSFVPDERRSEELPNTSGTNRIGRVNRYIKHNLSLVTTWDAENWYTKWRTLCLSNREADIRRIHVVDIVYKSRQSERFRMDRLGSDS